jgi:predicted MFS family arabinose efflux permease
MSIPMNTPTSLAASGAGEIRCVFLLSAFVPKEEWNDYVIRAIDLKRILSEGRLALLSLELFGIGSGSILVTTFMVFCLEQTLKLGPTLAGGIGSLTPLCSVVASPLSGMLYDSIKIARMLIFSSGLALAVTIGLLSIEGLDFAIVSTVIVGLCAGAFTVAYLAAQEVRSVSNEY